MSKNTLTPLADYIVAFQEKAKEQTASGLYLPETAKEKPQVAEVLAVGKDVKELKVGDRIIYKAYSTTEVKVDSDGDGKKVPFVLVKEEDVLAKVD
jgi:chaperonin GroES